MRHIIYEDIYQHTDVCLAGAAESVTRTCACVWEGEGEGGPGVSENWPNICEDDIR